MICKLFFVFVTWFCVSVASDLPPSFKKCRRSDSSFEVCLKGAIQNVLPLLQKEIAEFNVPSFQPLKVPRMTVGEGTGPVQVVQKFTNLNIYGLPHGVVENIDANFTDTRFNLVMDITHPELKSEADYELNGRILVLPIVGKGLSIIRLDNITARYEIHAEEFKKKDQSYYEITDFKMKIEPRGAFFNLMNLFNGNERLGNEMNKLLNENWKDIWEDVGHGYEDIVGLICKNIGNLIFKKVPHELMFPL